MSNAFKGYGAIGDVFNHEMIILEHPEQDKRKRRMCPCGCRKKSTHIQYCNGVGMNSGCENYITGFIDRINKQKEKIAKRQKHIDIIKDMIK